MDCTEVQTRLEEYEGGELSGIERIELEKHLQECKGCAETRQKINAAWNALDMLPVKEPDPFAHRRFLTKLEERTFTRKLSYALAAAVVLVVLATQWLFVPPSAVHLTASTSQPSSTATLTNQAASSGESTFSDLTLDESGIAFADVMFTNSQEDTP